MRFYLGTHEPTWLSRAHVPLFISAVRLRLRCKRKLPKARVPWALDSGGFAGDFATALSVNERHFKVGLTTRCTTGNLLGVGNVNVGGIDRRGQLIFERMTQPGDSGSIVVHEATNRIVGLHFAGFDDPVTPANSRSYSNPIYRVGFQLVGHYELLSGARVPIYDASRATVPVTPEQSLLAQKGVSQELFGLRSAEAFSPTLRRQIGGTLFLGTRTAFCTQAGNGLYGMGVEPVPVSGGDVFRVPVNIEKFSDFPPTHRCTVLYFG